MTVLERLELELNHKQYFDISEYRIFLSENNLNPDDNYDKGLMQRDLLYTVVDILEAVSNDVDLMRKVDTEFTTTSEAIKYLENRIEKIKDRILNIEDTEEGYSNVSLLFFRN